MEAECPQCNGTGLGETFAGHICLGDDRDCVRLCPIPMQNPCEYCLGEGTILVEPTP